MQTPHIEAKDGDVARTVLMPGDPLRARFIAENFLTNINLFNTVRGMLGFTGDYNGTRVSVMGSGMGMPSIGIYSWELYTKFGVENIIRVGSAGAYSHELKLYDILMVREAWSESSFAKTMSGYRKDTRRSHEFINEQLWSSAYELDKKLIAGRVHSTDVFYREQRWGGTPYWQTVRDEQNVLAVEMECFALFHIARVAKRRAACLLTVSDSLVHEQETTAKERETSFTDMMEVALHAAQKL